MRYTIYRTTNLLNGKFYIGKHQTTNPNDSYLGSGVLLEKAIAKHGRQNFKKEVLFDYPDQKSMDEKERELITEELVRSRQTYNAGVGGEGGAHFKGKKHTPEAKAKIAAGRPQKLSIEHRQKISEGNRRRILSPEARKNMAEAAKRRWARVH